ncbi:hypothetical protein EJ110_NYTH43111 [Nymphaea thermarum]|nr:hypothetical protein EJ110_NYTH43111 [Nymphaea thermarum]
MEKGDHVHHSPRRHHQDIVELLELNWFTGNVLYRSTSAAAHPNQPLPISPPPPAPRERSKPLNRDVTLPAFPLRSVRHNSLPEPLLPFLPESQTPFSPDSVLQTRKLETILSGKTYDAEDEEGLGSASSIPVVASPPRRRRARRIMRRRRASRSLSELEFEEVKGFIDLGFTFPSNDVSPTLARVVPGLQRLGIGADSGAVDGDGKREAVEEEEEGRRRRPYLSEAWDFYDRLKSPLEGWKLPDDADGVEMKEHLRTWAHRVASAVK